MIRGITRFKCNECSKKFWGLDVEWRATAFTAPLQCPQCKSFHTYPVGILGLGTGKAKLYKEIWESIDENKKHNTRQIAIQGGLKEERKTSHTSGEHNSTEG